MTVAFLPFDLSHLAGTRLVGGCSTLPRPSTTYLTVPSPFGRSQGPIRTCAGTHQPWNGGSYRFSAILSDGLHLSWADACTASKRIAWCLTCGSQVQLRGLVVLVDHAAEHFAALDRQVKRRAGLAVVVGWSLLVGLVRAVPVVMGGVLAQDRAQVPFAVDEHPVGALGSRGRSCPHERNHRPAGHQPARAGTPARRCPRSAVSACAAGRARSAVPSPR